MLANATWQASIFFNNQLYIKNETIKGLQYKKAIFQS